VFDLMKLDRFMPTHETREAAIGHLDTTTSAARPPATTRLRALSETIDLSLVDVQHQRRAV
jgi:hypothetical protein